MASEIKESGVMKNLKKYKADLDRLVSEGDVLLLTMTFECTPEGKRTLADKKIISKFPLFEDKYQSWYSESLVVVKQLLPDRLTDFISYYEIPKNRKEITKSTYVIADYLQKIQFKNLLDEIVVSKSFAISKFQQQLNILKAVQARFESSLFDIQQLVQADLFDDELAAAKMLNKNKFVRAAGAIAGVVLEKHLDQVLKNHNLICKKDTISPLNDALKAGNVYDIPTFRKIQHLGDIRNLCDHNSKREPTQEEVEEMINGVDSIIKTVF